MIEDYTAIIGTLDMFKSAHSSVVHDARRLSINLVDALDELDALKEQMRWRDVREELPLELDADKSYRQITVIATDGITVGTASFEAGSFGGEWRGFSAYGSIEKPTHWMHLPSHPTTSTDK